MPTPATPQRRLACRSLLALAASPWLGGCAETLDAADPAKHPPPSSAEPLLSPGHRVTGGFLAPPSPGIGIPARPGTGMFVKLMSPTAVALRGQDLLVLDAGTGRLWRADAMANTMTGIAGAPTGPGVALALGSDLSAWVLDPAARQVLRFGRDGRLMQTFRITTAQPGPAALALADGGLTLLLADGAGAQWSEQRGPAGIAQYILPTQDDGQRISGVDGLAISQSSGRESIWLLDRLAGVVHRAQRDGRVLQTLGRGSLMQPQAIAVDRYERVFVVDTQGRSLVCLHGDAPPQRLPVSQLGVQQIGGLAIDDRMLALSDFLTGQVVMHRLGRPAASP